MKFFNKIILKKRTTKNVNKHNNNFDLKFDKVLRVAISRQKCVNDNNFRLFSQLNMLNTLKC